AELDDCEINWSAHSLCGFRAPRRDRIEMVDFCHIGRPFAHDLDTHSAWSDVELLDAHPRADNERMVQHRGGDPLGERFKERDVLLRDDNPDAIGDDVIREHVSNIFHRMCPATHLDVDIETNILGLLAFAGVSADASGYHEIADEDVVGRGV